MAATPSASVASFFSVDALHFLIAACYHPPRRGTENGVAVRWLTAVFAIALACAWALPIRSAFAQGSSELLISPTRGEPGTLFQIVGESGWTPGETVTLTFGFADLPADNTFAGATYHERQVTVLRDGTWSFPVVINADLFPFPLWRPGYIVVRASSPSRTDTGDFVYTVEGKLPLGTPPLAAFGFGPPPPDRTAAAALALLCAGTGALLSFSGAWRRRDEAAARR